MRSADFFSILLQMILINCFPSKKTCGYYFFFMDFQRSHYIDNTVIFPPAMLPTMF